LCGWGLSAMLPFIANNTHDRAISLVLDTSSLLRGGSHKLAPLAEQFYTIPEVLAEIRDQQTRQDLTLLPFEIKVRIPDGESVRVGRFYESGSQAAKDKCLTLVLSISIRFCEKDRRLCNTIGTGLESLGSDL
jgi:rRNA maturation endonuclease Nob1